ncbi:MAG: hypothetical protein ACNS63_07880 [Candidatus Nitrospinota bacterium M3_3B_026]
MEMNLTGWKAVVALLVVAAVGGFNFFAMEEDLHGEVAEKIEFELMPEYHGPDIAALKGAVDSGDKEAAAALSKAITGREIEFKSISKRGWGENVIVRVEVLVDGQTPYVGEPVRYFKFRYSPVFGWRYKYETWWLSYYLKLW